MTRDTSKDFHGISNRLGNTIAAVFIASIVLAVIGGLWLAKVTEDSGVYDYCLTHEVQCQQSRDAR